MIVSCSLTLFPILIQIWEQPLTARCSYLGLACSPGSPCAAADQEKHITCSVVPSVAPTKAAAEEEQASPPLADEAPAVKAHQTSCL